MTVGKILRELRIQQGLTIAQLAIVADVSQSSITRIEADYNVDRRVIAKLCIGLDTTLADVETQTNKAV